MSLSDPAFEELSSEACVCVCGMVGLYLRYLSGTCIRTYRYLGTYKLHIHTRHTVLCERCGSVAMEEGIYFSQRTDCWLTDYWFSRDFDVGTSYWSN